MKIGLVAVDRHNFPNLPLMKLSTWHKEQGNQVEFYQPLKGEGYYDRIYVSKIFTDSKDYQYPLYSDDVVFGGTGYDLENTLPSEVEKMYPDYSLYNITDTAYGFLTRGCPRNCSFCIVGEKEGLKSYKVVDLDQFWRGQKDIKLLDPNLLACKERMELLQQLKASGAWIDFTQGLDIRLMTEEIADLIMQCKIKMIHFAWDKEEDSESICKKLKEFKKQTNISRSKAVVYVLTNYDTDFEFDLYRVQELKEMGFDPYVMIYNKAEADRKYRQLQRWVNNKFIFHSGTAETFEDFIKFRR